jgi:phosphohistidine phosphatase SixA
MLVCMLLAAGSPARADDAAAWQALRDGGMVIFRHALAPGTGDPRNFRLEDCSTQRNLNQAGRAQARGMGEAFRQRGIHVGGVLSSQWCRAVDTARLGFGDVAEVKQEPIFNSFFNDRTTAPEQTAAARALLLGWNGPGALVVVTHQVNITDLTDIFPASGEGAVLQRRGGTLAVVGRIRP